MSFPAYSKYKDSGIPWLCEVPSHWHAAHLRWLARRYSGGTPDKRNIDFWENGTIPWLGSGEVNQRTVLKPTTYITEDALAQSSAKWVPTGALVMALAGQGKTKGMVAQMAIDATCNQSMAAIVPRDEEYARYLFWWLEANYQNIRNMAGGDLRDGLNLELLGDIDCPIPTSSEQTAIASFLDRETAKIDALVAEQERLIALLKEKRQAVISHAVTKGLNANAPMKDSGIEWLGEIPAHWRHTRTSRVFKLGMGQTILSETLDEAGDWPVFSATEGDHYFGRIFEPNLRLAAGDLIIPARGNSIGHVKIASEPCTTTQTTIYAKILNRNEISPAYAYWFMRGLKKWLFPFVQTAIPQITTAEIGANVILVPGMSEQLAIVDHVKGVVAQYEGLVAEAQAAITLLQERRAALISAAVTGKIDVRELAETSKELELA